VHDSYARGDTLYAAHIVNGFFSVLDVSNKANPIVLAQQLTPGVFTHNVWLSDDGQYLFTTDEVSGASIASYDISDLADVQYLDEVRSYQGNGSIPHNVYYKDGWLVTSYYRDGVNVVDAHDPSNLIEVGYYDVSPLTGNGFNSIWGVYPFFASGNLILSDMDCM
jgi:choice-of-anchor B domain-containing protein